MKSLEERLLRVLYEGPHASRACAAAMLAGEAAPQAFLDRIEVLLAALEQRGHVCARAFGSETRFELTPHGSERLAALVEDGERSHGRAS